MSDPVNTCRCGTEFVFRRHETTGRSSPIETEPSERGNVEVLPDGRYRINPGSEGPRYLSHFANCQYARDYRLRHPN